MRGRGARTDSHADRPAIERINVGSWKARSRSAAETLALIEQQDGSETRAIDVLDEVAQRVERRLERTPRSNDLQQPLLSCEQRIGLLARSDVSENQIGCVPLVVRPNALSGDMGVKARPILATPDDFPLDSLPGEQIRIFRQDRFELVQHY